MSSDDDFAPPAIPEGVTLARVGNQVAPIASSAPPVDPQDDAVEDAEDDSSSEGMIGPVVTQPRVSVIDDEDSLSFETDIVGPEVPYTEVHDRPIESFPLFMDSAPGEGEENSDVSALQELLSDGTPEEQADNFKTQRHFQGNQCLARGYKYWDDAIVFYTRALAVGCEDAQRNSVFRSNRAAVHILKKNFGRAAKDCVVAVELNPRNVKAMYRAALSYYEIRKLDEALKYLRKCMEFSKGKEVLGLEKKIAKLMRLESSKEEKKSRNLEKAADEMMQIRKHINDRGYKIGTEDIYLTKPRMEAYDAEYQLLDVPDRRTGRTRQHLICPVVTIYPQGHSSDFVKEWSEEMFMHDLLQTLFSQGNPPMEWDTQGWYTHKELNNLMIYVKTNDIFDTYKKQEWVKVKLSMTLGEAMRVHSDYIIPIVPTFYVIHIKWKNMFMGPEVQRRYGVPTKSDE